MIKGRILSVALFLVGFVPLCLAQEAPDRTVVPTISSTQNTEFSPTISADGRVMIFESDVDKKKGWELFESRLNEQGVWSQPVALKAINEKCNFLAGPSLSYDGNTLYFTAFIEDVTQSEDIYYSERLSETAWSEPKSIGAPINTEEGYEGFPSISADGNSLYFIRVNEENPADRKSKESCFTIYVSKRQPDNTWGEPTALPAPINLGCERDPKIMADNHTLIFSSIREGGKGKYDLYQTRLQPDGSWAEPVSLDFINAEDNDQSPCISAAGDIMFFYSLKDIYSVTIPSQYRQMINVTVQGFVKDFTTKAPLKAQLHVKEVGTENEFFHESNPVDGLYSIVLAAGKKYEVQVLNDQYLSETLRFDFEKQDRYLEVKQDVLLKSEYVLNLTVADRDLKTPLTAYLSVSGSPALYQDTLRAAQSPLKLMMKAGHTYDLKANARSFPLVSETWKFDPRLFQPEMSYTLNLIHEKVKYLADVTNIVTNQKTKMKVHFNNDTVDEVIVAEAGDAVYLRKGDRYQVMTSSDKGYFFSTSTIVAGDGQPNENGVYAINMTVIPIEEGAQITLNHIVFDFNSAVLEESSFVELDRVVELLTKNPTLNIEIAAHTDDVGTDEYNLRLSEKRALGVVDYLARKGAAPGRLKPIGYGKTRPLLSNETEENRSKNRRVELRVLKIN